MVLELLIFYNALQYERKRRQAPGHAEVDANGSGTTKAEGLMGAITYLADEN